MFFLYFFLCEDQPASEGNDKEGKQGIEMAIHCSFKQNCLVLVSHVLVLGML